MRPVLQTEATECGLASMVMVAQYHGHKIDLNVMRQRFGLSLKGAGLRDLMNMADELGFSTRALRLEPEHLKDILLPAILHWDLNHFVVLKEVKRRKFIVLDPARGRIECIFSEFSNHFTGVALEVVPAANFAPIEARLKTRLNSLWGRLAGLKRSFIQILILSMVMQLFVLASPFYLQLVIDEAVTRFDEDFLLLLALGFGFQWSLGLGRAVIWMEGQPKVIILGTKKDDHVTRVSDQLIRLGLKPVVIDYLEKTRVQFLVDEVGVHELRVDSEVCCPPFLIWDRRKVWTPGLTIEGNQRSSHYETQEWNALYGLLVGTFSDWVVNTPYSRRCLLKPYQQIVAAKVGFHVPPTAVTNDKEDSLKFAADQARVVIKSLSAGKVIPNPHENSIPYNVMTMQVSEEALNAATEEEIGRCPHFFQRKISKSYELRIVAVGDSLFAFRINSQTRALTRLDWRNGIQTLQFVPVEIEETISFKIRRFMDCLNLFAGSFDLIIDLQDRCWFLECNQDGQWSWLDSEVNGRIAFSFANALAKHLSNLSQDRLRTK